MAWKEYIKNINENTNKDNIIELHCECSTIYYLKSIYEENHIGMSFKLQISVWILGARLKYLI